MNTLILFQLEFEIMCIARCHQEFMQMALIVWNVAIGNHRMPLQYVICSDKSRRRSILFNILLDILVPFDRLIDGLRSCRTFLMMRAFYLHSNALHFVRANKCVSKWAICDHSCYAILLSYMMDVQTRSYVQCVCAMCICKWICHQFSKTIDNMLRISMHSSRVTW